MSYQGTKQHSWDKRNGGGGGGGIAGNQLDNSLTFRLFLTIIPILSDYDLISIRLQACGMKLGGGGG